MKLRELAWLMHRIVSEHADAHEWEIVVGVREEPKADLYIGQIQGIVVEVDDKRAIVNIGNVEHYPD